MHSDRINTLLSKIYGPEKQAAIVERLVPILDSFRGKVPAPARTGLNERDAILITYPDQVQEPGRPPLASLGDFCDHHLAGAVSGIHILPFYPWSSDDGFSVVDYESVAPEYGDWAGIRRLGSRFRLMFDAVINHASAQGLWFKGFLRGDPAYAEYFIQIEGNPDLSAVVRPRALPLLAEFQTPAGPRHLWTTFSADQVDLNYQNPQVLLRILQTLLFYASQGAQFLRLDAIAYLWKQAGTPSINLPQAHWIVQLIRAVLDEAAPHVMLITETNVPHLENLSYFGDGANEAQLVYNFPLPPLVLHAMHAGNSSHLTAWASSLALPSPQATFLNFLASHDGIGLNPARGILPESEIAALARRVEAAGGFVSSKSNSDGTTSPYELNINYFDALNAAHQEEVADTQVERFVTAHAILFAFRGMPAVYFHSLFGSRGWPEGVRQTGRSRSINREKLQRAALEAELSDPSSLRARVFGRLSRLLFIRAAHAAFSPFAAQHVLDAGPAVFAWMRQPQSTDAAVLCMHNLSRARQRVEIDLSNTPLAPTPELQDLISGRPLQARKTLSIDLMPYASAWIAG